MRCPHGLLNRRRRLCSLEDRCEIIECTEPGVLKAFRFAAEIAEAGRDGRAYHRDAEKVRWRRAQPVQVEVALGPEFGADGFHAREEIADGERRIDVLDDEPEAICGRQVRPNQHEHLHVGLEVAAGALGELGLQRPQFIGPDHRARARNRPPVGPALLQFQVSDARRRGPQLADFRADPDGLGQAGIDNALDTRQERRKRNAACFLGPRDGRHVLGGHRAGSFLARDNTRSAGRWIRRNDLT
jgi:hypothetical protein